ncbi:hypothetical protein BJ322DRAFT_1016908 [Thelephora terrestris]|uniref:F-box domain-containing protein n=1 Tax=Thelephora terrestris TaxID=56493 RepID=A0A9P6HRG0_9AGAM|nr:hypothetical protein BJ322DRAFT_1016908 [Thelephora terrestris]
MTDLAQRLPLEILAKILEHASVLEVLTFEQHKIELYAAGLEYNAAAEINLADSQNAHSRYCSSMDSLCPVGKMMVSMWRDNLDRTRSGGGVHVIFQESVRLFALGSASRGIPHREWEIPLPVADPAGCCLCPDGDVIAFVERW